MHDNAHMISYFCCSKCMTLWYHIKAVHDIDDSWVHDIMGPWYHTQYHAKSDSADVIYDISWYYIWFWWTIKLIYFGHIIATITINVIIKVGTTVTWNLHKVPDTGQPPPPFITCHGTTPLPTSWHWQTTSCIHPQPSRHPWSPGLWSPGAPGNKLHWWCWIVPVTVSPNGTRGSFPRMLCSTGMR